jgi:hypothetical protein
MRVHSTLCETVLTCGSGSCDADQGLLAIKPLHAQYAVCHEPMVLYFTTCCQVQFAQQIVAASARCGRQISCLFPRCRENDLRTAFHKRALCERPLCAKSSHWARALAVIPRSFRPTRRFKSEIGRRPYLQDTSARLEPD